MPTPVSAARQCLKEEAARALDDAVTVARRRNHAQTTSLHVVSALLALPSATLRDACTRARSRSYSQRLQFRALELSVGVSLDRLQTMKTSSAVNGGADDGPPLSNSLMAAIRRSQANQRRQPENFHLLQMMQHQQQGTTSFLKVELKHFMLSILDDPIVGRVFAEAGFRSYDIKLALLQPPLPSSSSSRFFSRPVFLCNLEPVQAGLTFLDDNSKRIVDVLLRKNQRNPLLMGVYAKSALKSFIETVRIRRVLLPCELAQLSVVCVEKEIVEFLSGSEENMGLKFKEVSYLVEQCKGSGSGGGVAVNFGEIEVFIGDGVGFVVEQLKRLIEVHDGKVWLIGVAGTSNAYSKFLGLFPTVDKDWDLQLLTMTSATTSMEGLYSKSNLMGSFVPFGGFFSTPSEFTSPISCTTNASLTRCDTCNEKYEQEVADFLKVDPATSAKCSYSTTLPWLQKVNVDTDKGLNVAKTTEENTSSNAKIFGLRKKWNCICQRLHNNGSLPLFDTQQTRFQAPSLERFPFGSGFKESSSQGLSLHEIQCSNQISNISEELQSTLPSKPTLPVSVPSDTGSISIEADHVPRFSKTSLNDLTSHWISPSAKANMNLLDHKSYSPVAPVTTDLGLGTIYTSAAHEPDTPKLCDHKKHLQHLSDSISTDFDATNENTSNQIARSSSCSGPNLELKFGSEDFKSLYQILTEKVGWQDEAIYVINQAISLCRSGARQRSGPHVRADIWLAFLGPDRLGKRKIASALAEILFGNKESLISVDLSSQDSFYPLNSVFEFRNSCSHDMSRRKTCVDYIAGELSKMPHSVVFLENVDKADFLLQSSLFKAIRTGRFPYSLGREIGINNAIFIVTSTLFKGDGSFVLEEPKIFPEERILEAKRFHMQLSIRLASEDAKRIGSTNVMVAPRNGTSIPSFLNKRKLVESMDSKEKDTCKTPKQVREALRSYLDLNMPLEEDDEAINYNHHETESLVEKSAGWLNDLCDQIDGKVIFKPFNFDLLAEQVIKSIDIEFQRSFGSEVVLEIDYEVMAQILAAAWLSDKKNSVQDWVERVLGRSFNEFQWKYHPAMQHVMKLVKCECIHIEEHAPGVCLPPLIKFN
ncbi:PREDICTED: protein SMAX1-LIKE 7-like [Lupinus angustifolius]|uniref:protein SMAX1-LIKE 7-like n=1 Tax=Lupinus angustifolius TaxID=3871 RepID=UPI00092EF8D8|nr:PREDICTED: protein SMAX1-LIKE 7-like [Lupinus angustifolius]